MQHLVNVRQKIWKDEEVKALIKLYKEHKDDFSNHLVKVVDVWKTISEKLMQQGISKSGVDCDKKFRNLKSAFKKIYSDTERTEESKYQWEFYEELLDVMLSDKQLRRAAPIPPIDKQSQNKNQQCTEQAPEKQVTHVYRMDPELENVHTISYSGDSKNISQTIFFEIETNQPFPKRIRLDNKPTDVQADIARATDDTEETTICNNTEEFETLEYIDTIEENLEKSEELHLVNDEEPPLWFQNAHMKYETSIKLMQDKLNKIFERQELQNTILEHISNRLAKIEKRLTITNN